MRDIFVFGGGAWGSALAGAFSLNNMVYIISRRDLGLVTSGERLRQVRMVDFYSLYKKSRDPLCVIAIKSAALRGFLTESNIDKDAKVLVASKGMEYETDSFMDDVLRNFFDQDNLCYLTGPSFAKEVVHHLPCAVVIHSRNPGLASVYASCMPDFIKPYIGDDVIGGEVAGAYKNVIAIAGGISDGLSLGCNSKASLISRGLVEMSRFGIYFGAKMETFLGLSGSGDLFLTSASSLSRNYRVGIGLSKGRSMDSILNDIGEVAEGVDSAKSIFRISKRNGLYTPIVDEVYEILNGRDVGVSIRNLLSRN